MFVPVKILISLEAEIIQKYVDNNGYRISFPPHLRGLAEKMGIDAAWETRRILGRFHSFEEINNV